MKQLAYRLLDDASRLMLENRADEALPKFELALAAAFEAGEKAACTVVARSAGLAYEQAERLDDAIRCFEVAVANEPGDGRSHLTLARLQQQCGQDVAAKIHARQALEIASETGDVELESFVKRAGIL